jgi:hypothetical protein
MNILSRFLVVLTLLVVSWGAFGVQHPQSTDLSNLTSPSSSVLVANVTTNNTVDDYVVTISSPKLDWNRNTQEVKNYPVKYQAQIALILNNEPVAKVEKSLNVSAAMMPHWGMMMPRWGMMMPHWGMMMPSWGMMMPSWGVMMPRWGMMMPSWGVMMPSWGMMPHWGMMMPSWGMMPHQGMMPNNKETSPDEDMEKLSS